MLDVYELPNDFPGQNTAARNPSNASIFAADLESAFGADVDFHRFIPHLQLHEFETMLFADPEAFAIAFENCEAAIDRLKQIAESVSSVEQIDDGRETAPSKRIIAVIPEFEGRKSTAGPEIAEYIGLPKIREKCPHFDRWLTRLEGLPWQ